MSLLIPYYIVSDIFRLKKEENNDNDEIGPLGGALRKKNWKFGPSMKLPYSGEITPLNFYSSVLKNKIMNK